MADLHTEEILATNFCNGKQHDFELFRQGQYLVAPGTWILADAGYQGLSKLHSNSQTPAKKSKFHPLSQEQKAPKSHRCEFATFAAKNLDFRYRESNLS